jgi:sulfite exporter TauE/SafE
MEQPITLISALLVGLFGGVHCAGMCGPIVGALSAGVDKQSGQRFGARLLFQFLYNTGRIASYTLAGALFGLLGHVAMHSVFYNQAQTALQVIAAIFMFALGLYLAGWWFGLQRLERLGTYVWKRIEPLGRRFLPIRNGGQALVVGLIWGWLPCGMVYSALAWSMSGGSAGQGALLMLSFGLGTLPNLLGLGLLASTLQPVLNSKLARRIAGVLVMLFAVWLVVKLGMPMKHQH